MDLSVISQRIGQGKGNGAMGALYIDQGLIPYVVRFFCTSLEQHFPPWQSSCSIWKSINQNNIVVMPWPAKIWLSIGGVSFKDDLMKSKQGRQRQPNLVHPSSEFRLVFLWHLSTIQCAGYVLLLSTPMHEMHDACFRSSFVFLKYVMYWWQKYPKKTF